MRSVPVPADAWQTVAKTFLWAYAGPVPEDASRFTPFEHSGGWLVLKGSASIRMKEITLTAKKGEWLFPPPRGVLEQQFEPGTHLLSVRFRCEGPGHQPIYAVGLPQVCPGVKFPELRTAGRKLAALCRIPGARPAPAKRQSLDVIDHLKLDAAFAQFLLHWSLALHAAGVSPDFRTPPDPRIAQALRLMEQNKWTARQIAATVSLSISQLNRLFTQHLNQSPGEFKDMQRKEAVCLQLQQTALPVKVIAYQNGFRRLSHFSAWFRRGVGMSPRAYRARSLVC